MNYPGLLEKLYHWETYKPNDLYLREPVSGIYREITWKQAGQEIRKMASYLVNLNLPEGSRIAILSKNCSHWFISDLAIMMAGHVSVPLYPNLTSQSVRQILEHSECKVAFVGKLDDYEAMESGIPENVIKVSFPYYPRHHLLQWNDLVSNIIPLSINYIPDPHSIATILYTSGTTGVPKGVMQSHHNMAFVACHAVKTLELKEGERFFSYLPLCHIAEKMLVEVGSLYVGGTVSFAESLDTFSKDIKNARMTVFLAVPRIWTKFQQSILQKIPQKKLDTYLKIPGVAHLIKYLIRKKLGLIKADHIFSGAAAASPAMLEFFARLGIQIQEAYAMTENCCYSNVNLKKDIRIGSVGHPLPYVEVRISEEGEILVRHEALMKGYFKEPELTAETFTQDGFLKTGDEGHFDGDGFLWITGRIKDLFKSSKGKYISPLPIEMKLMENEDIEQVCVVGHGLPQPIVLSVLSDIGKSKPVEHLMESFHQLMDKVNKQLDQHESLAKMVILKSSWTIENGILTPTMKVKRKIVDEVYSIFYNTWYELTDRVIVV